MKVTALAGGVGAGKFLRGLVRAVPPDDVTIIVNTGDDIELHGLRVCPDIDSVVYWLGGVADRERGWGRAGETFRATEELRAFGSPGAWFGLGDLDLATHLFRTQVLRGGATLSAATEMVARRFGVAARVLPMSDDPVTTMVSVLDGAGRGRELHFQEYWVLEGARGRVKELRYEGAPVARPAAGVLEAVSLADAILLCPSNPIASIGPILAVPGMKDAIAARRDRVTGISPIVAGAPLRGMADKLLSAAGVEVSAAGVASFYEGLIAGWVIDEADESLAEPIRDQGLEVVVTNTIMTDDAAAEDLARAALKVALRA